MAPRLKDWLTRHLPDPVLEAARRGKHSKGFRRVRSALRVGRMRAEGAPITADDLARDLRELGIVGGSRVMVHAALSGLGFVEGGPETVVGALLECVGPDGLIAMPCNPATSASVESLTTEVFDPARTPCLTGKISETFRTGPGVVRSLHPTHSVAAIGPGAQELVCDHHTDDTPFGPHSPYAKLVEHEVSIAGLGLDTRWFTYYHYFEEFRANYPIRVYTEEVYEASVRAPDGSILRVRTPRHDARVASARLNNVPETLATVDAALTKYAGIRRKPLGRGTATLVTASGVLQTLQRMLDEDGQTIYNVEMLRNIAPDALLAPFAPSA